VNTEGTSALLLRGGTVIDGTGAPRFAADIRIERERIVAIGPALPAHGATVLDVTGRIVAPGFIDVHTHDDQIVLAAPEMLPKISQGVTTVVVGNCGISLAPLMHADVPPPLNLLGNKFVHPTMAAYAADVDRTRPAWRRCPIPIDPRLATSRRAWSSCCAKGWTQAPSA
jgi:N-acyl-D-amino-acid deacylase